MSKRAAKIGAITKRISKNLLGLRRDMVALGRVIQVVAEAKGHASARGTAAPAGGRARKRRKLTAADRERLLVQGEYLGLVRHLSVRSRAKVKEIRARRGYGPAIKEARRLGKGRS